LSIVARSDTLRKGKKLRGQEEERKDCVITAKKGAEKMR
jgi:hypothetical protein